MSTELNNLAKNELYRQLLQEVEALIDDDWCSSLANVSALLNQRLLDLNWVGFYLLKNEQLVLGPFQGKPACTRIALGRGVCGRAALMQKTLRVDDVGEFVDHIVCDMNSKSEIVLPLLVRDPANPRAMKCVGVLDIDSPRFSRFDSDDQKGLEKIAQVLSERVSLT